jgi:HAD superfamily hydrolase (TIGR01509 family)
VSGSNRSDPLDGLRHQLASGVVRAVSFDLFDTLVSVDPARLPHLNFNGANHRSTLPLLADALAPEYPAATRIEILNTLASQPVRPPFPPEQCREIPDQFLFEAVLSGLGAPRYTHPEILAARLCDIQMEAIAASIHACPGALEVLRALRTAGFRVALLSNLSHASAIGNLLSKSGLEGLFDATILSENIGFCKPHPAMFRALLEKLNLSPQHIVHIGDDAVADIWGASSFGMRSIWLSPAARPYPAGRHQPTWTISDLRQLRPHIP